MELIIASNNQHKIDEIKTILKDKFSAIYSLAEAGIVCDPEENGKTFLENALIKAHAVAQHTTLAVLADDTGLCVDALGGEPGVFSARYAEDGHDDKANRKKLLQKLQGATSRKAHFECAVVLRYPNGKTLCVSGRVEGKILAQEQGENGFGYDSLFFCTELGKTFAEASAQEKNSVSHRGRALQNLSTLLQNCDNA